MSGSQKDRTKTVSAYDNNRVASALGDGSRVQYNLIRPHLALEKTAGVVTGLPAVNGWRHLIELGAMRPLKGAMTQ